jgi:hypothetical protein
VKKKALCFQNVNYICKCKTKINANQKHSITVKNMENKQVKQNNKTEIMNWLPSGAMTAIAQKHSIDFATFKRALKSDLPKPDYMPAIKEAYQVALAHKKELIELKQLKQQLQEA